MPSLPRARRLNRWRSLKDRAARWLVALGGVTVLFFVVLIFFYLVWVVVPLFLPAGIEHETTLQSGSVAADETVLLELDDSAEVGLRLRRSGRFEFFDTRNNDVVLDWRFPANGIELAVAEHSSERDGTLALAFEDGTVRVAGLTFETRFSGGVETRQVVPEVLFPFGKEALLSTGGEKPRSVALSTTENDLVLAVSDGSGRVWVNRAGLSTHFLTGETAVESQAVSIAVDGAVTGLAVSSDHRWLYVGDRAGHVHAWDLRNGELIELVMNAGSPVSVMQMLTGGGSLLVGTRDGTIAQVFPVDAGEGQRPEFIRRFENLGEPVADILPERYRRGFAVLGAEGTLSIYHSTSERTLVRRESVLDPGRGRAALSSRADRLMVQHEDGSFDVYGIENRHPEVSIASLWAEVWYERYPEPRYVWQSSAATSSFEPKFSLVPLVFGTLKAAIYAMLFAVPMALMAAVYTAYFMSPGLRGWLKPAIEMMAALPTVILGFLAGLWFAPILEANLAGFFLFPAFMAVGLVAFVALRGWLPARLGAHALRGMEPLVLLPVIVVLGVLAFWLDDPVQAAFFGGDLSHWLEAEAGISYNQRNSLVIGVAMGFAVIPIIFSLAEDALHDVPESLSSGSLALGATRWQTLARVVLPVASPGIFAALMIGMGRAVGETMIILMATGNTPIMDWNVFEGMRTLAANIAIEMPESELGSSHYRILFLSALVLFAFTFIINTAAELIRQRLRSRYKAL